ncbi:MAG TPA: dTDP-4-dehydrorhamnose reductase [Gammaproteobacteria bacterium]|nr:dTDP-4-dehydrorhamnose reductase [Gammaproteobacteria bacterium]
MRLLVTGATGQLGSELARKLTGLGHEVFAPDPDDLDLLDPVRVAATIREQRWDWVINCAAYTAVDKAESAAEQAFVINRDCPGEMARSVAGYGGRMLQVSTDFIFSGDQRCPYTETDIPKPLGVYGRSKLEGEQVVLEMLPDATVLRTAWVYGVYGHNFVKTMLRVAAEGRPLRVVNDQMGTPTWTADIVMAIVALVEQQAGGTYHFTAAGQASWYGFASAILEDAARIGFPVNTDAVVPILTSEYPTPARRPAYSVLDTRKIEPLLPSPPPEWRDSLNNMLKELATCADCL